MMNYTIGLWGMKWNQSMSSLPLWTGDHVTLEFVCRVSGWTEVVKRSDHLAPAKIPQPSLAVRSSDNAGRAAHPCDTFDRGGGCKP